jgi:hypothetical protein
VGIGVHGLVPGGVGGFVRTLDVGRQWHVPDALQDIRERADKGQHDLGAAEFAAGKDGQGQFR